MISDDDSDDELKKIKGMTQKILPERKTFFSTHYNKHKEALTPFFENVSYGQEELAKETECYLKKLKYN